MARTRFRWSAPLATVLVLTLTSQAPARTRPAPTPRPVASDEPVIVTGVSWSDRQLRVEATRPLHARLMFLDAPDRVVIDLFKAELADPALAQAVPIQANGFKGLRAAIHSEEGFIRLVLDCDRPARAKLVQDDDGTVLRVVPRFADDAPLVYGPPCPSASPTLGPPVPRGFFQYGPPIDETLLTCGPPVPAGYFRYGPPTPEPSVATPAPTPIPALRYGHAAWDGLPQPLERIALSHPGRRTVVHLMATRKLAYEIAQEYAPPRLVIRVPRGSLAGGPPEIAGTHGEVTQENGDWVWRLSLPRALNAIDATRDEDGQGIRVSWQSVPLNGTLPLVVVDAGHGGMDPGAIGPSGQHESLVTLGLARALQRALEASGRVQVAMTRSADIAVDLASRAKLTAALHPALFVSMHGNSCSTPEIGGLETFYRSASSLPLARLLHREILHDLGRPDRGVRQARLYVLRNPEIPSVLIESGYVSNHGEETLLADPAFQRDLARSLSQGILEYLDRAPVASALRDDGAE